MTILPRAEKSRLRCLNRGNTSVLDLADAPVYWRICCCFLSDEQSSPVPFICCRGRVLLWIRALGPDPVRADTSAESQTRARSPGTNTGSRTATEQWQPGGGVRNSGRIVGGPLADVPDRVSKKTVKSRARRRVICWRLFGAPAFSIRLRRSLFEF